MTTTLSRQAFLFASTILIHLSSTAQEPRAFNQNASRSNIRGYDKRIAAWSFGMTEGVAFPLKSNEGNLFRGKSAATKFIGEYRIANIGLSVSGGFIPGTIDKTPVDEFIQQRKFSLEQPEVTSGKGLNAFLLAGPVIHFGERVQVSVGV